jgi:hypothetical protein
VLVSLTRTAVRVLVQVLYSTFNGSSSVQMLAVLAQLSPQVLSDAAVAHALAVRQATVSSNWVAFFKLYPKTPNTGVTLMDLYKDTVRSLPHAFLGWCCMSCHFRQ